MEVYVVGSSTDEGKTKVTLDVTKLYSKQQMALNCEDIHGEGFAWRAYYLNFRKHYLKVLV